MYSLYRLYRPPLTQVTLLRQEIQSKILWGRTVVSKNESLSILLKGETF